MDTISGSARDAAEYFPGIQGDLTAAVLDRLKKATENPAAFNKFINSRRKLLIRPYMKSAAAYIVNILETSLSVDQIITTIRNNLEA